MVLWGRAASTKCWETVKTPRESSQPQEISVAKCSQVGLTQNISKPSNYTTEPERLKTKPNIDHQNHQRKHTYSKGDKGCFLELKGELSKPFKHYESLFNDRRSLSQATGKDWHELVEAGYLDVDWRDVEFPIGSLEFPRALRRGEAKASCERRHFWLMILFETWI